MRPTTLYSEDVIAELASRHGFSADAVTRMLGAVRDGWGGMAAFDHPEFGGAGQWMRGGMIMLSDHSNHGLRARVDGLCEDIAARLAARPELVDQHTTATPDMGRTRQSQSQSSGPVASSGFDFGQQNGWWPAALGTPNATGQQNDMRYAYFADMSRLAIQQDGRIAVYDTGDHRISGVSQQQADANGSLSFASQHGTVDLDRLERIPLATTHDENGSREPGQQEPAPAPSHAPKTEAFDAIERLGELRAKGLLTEDEFSAKKAELLQRV